mgnify:CR=1 FL=1
MVGHCFLLLIVILCLYNLVFDYQNLLLYSLYLFLLIEEWFLMFFVLRHLHLIPIHLLHWSHYLQILILLVSVLLFRLHNHLYFLHYKSLLHMLLYFLVQLLPDFSYAYILLLLMLLRLLVLYLQLVLYHICFDLLVLYCLQRWWIFLMLNQNIFLLIMQFLHHHHLHSLYLSLILPNYIQFCFDHLDCLVLNLYHLLNCCYNLLSLLFLQYFLRNYRLN